MHDIVVSQANNRYVADLFRERGRLYCGQGATHEKDHPDIPKFPLTDSDCKFMGCKQHAGKPLLFVDDNGLCTIVPATGSLSFVRLPSNEILCVEGGKEFVQKEIAEVLCFCGICLYIARKESKNPTRFLGIEMPHGHDDPYVRNMVGIENREYPAPKQGSLSSRHLGWIDAREDASRESLKKWMLAS